MKTIIAALALAMQELKTKADSALKGMGPVDQYQNAQEVSYAIKSLNYSKECVEQMLTQVDEIMQKYDGEIAAAAQPIAASLLQEKITAGEVVLKTDHDLAIDNAKKEGEQVAATRFAAEKQETEAIAARRDEIVTLHGADVAAVLPDAVFVAAAFTDAAKAEISRRVTTLTELGVVAAEKKAAFAEIMTCGAFDAEGSTAFDNRITILKDVLGDRKVAVVAAAKKPAIAGTNPPAIGGAGAAAAATDEEKTVAIF